jgi:penicillin-binding protein 1A
MAKKTGASPFNKYIKYFWMAAVTPPLLLLLLILGASFGLFGSLPTFEELENPKSNLASEVYASDQVILGKYYFQNRSSIRYKDLAPTLVKALKATEDVRFEEHSGIDIRGLFRVMVKTLFLRNESSGGGSTITQQLAKNLFHEKPKNKIKRVFQKIQEWIIAAKLERRYTKEEILAMYLNTVEFGSNAFGIKSAARTFYNKSTDSLNVQEAAMLVGLLQAPSKYSPVRKPKNALARRNIVLSQMKKYGFIASEKALDSLMGLPVKLSYQPEGHTEGLATYFRESLRLELLEWCKQHTKADGSQYNLYRDGIRIYTTINSRMQRYAEEAVAEHLKSFQDKFNQHWKGKGDPWGAHTEVLTEGMKRSDRYMNLKKEGLSDEQIKKNFNSKTAMTIFSWHGEIDTVMTPMDSIKYYKYFLQTGFMSMEPQTGFVKAWVGGLNYKFFKYDHVKDGKRQVGSTFKPFLYTLAMQEGYSPCFKVPNIPITFVNDKGDKWTPENAENDEDGKMMTLKEALSKSVNRVSAYLIKQFGPQAVINIARKMGITSQIDPYPSICLGTPDVSVFEMVGAYSTFANKGQWTEPIYITRIEDKNGNVIQEFLPKKVEAISEETAYLMVNLLQGVVQHGTGTGLYRYKLAPGIGGKTGTTQNHSDGWFIGITPELVSGAWVGCEDRSVHFRSITMGQGAAMALPIWGLYMEKVYADKKLKISKADFEKPPHLDVETNCQKYVEPKGNDGFGNGF